MWQTQLITICSLSGRLYTYFNRYSVTSPLLWPQGEDISDTTRDGGSLVFLAEQFHDGKVPSGRSAFEGSRNTGNILRSKQTIVIRLWERPVENSGGNFWGSKRTCRGRLTTRNTSHTTIRIIVTVDVPHSWHYPRPSDQPTTHSRYEQTMARGARFHLTNQPHGTDSFLCNCKVLS
jgi:hypothetical protein